MNDHAIILYIISVGISITVNLIGIPYTQVVEVRNSYTSFFDTAYQITY